MPSSGSKKSFNIFYWGQFEVKIRNMSFEGKFHVDRANIFKGYSRNSSKEKVRGTVQYEYKQTSTRVV